ncbi:MAG: hypothetical protein VKL97_03775 [Cyanobacteriota bacterium]|nr:hypothetical protein [Cyanobacteriota bacterium]
MVVTVIHPVSRMGGGLRWCFSPASAQSLQASEKVMPQKKRLKCGAFSESALGQQHQTGSCKGCLKNTPEHTPVF